MRKTIIYIAILGLLGYGVWFFLFKDKSVFEEDEAGFTIKDTAAVYKIFLADKRGDTISLSRTGEGWMVNGRYGVSRGMMETLMETLHSQAAAYPVQEAAHNNVIKQLAVSAVKVELFDKDGGLIRTFYVGGQVSGNNGTYMLVEGAQRPYVVQLPVYQGYLTPRYSTSLKDWRDRSVVDLPPAQLESVEVKYVSPDEYLNSFTLLRKDDGSFTINTHPELKMGGEPNPRRVKTYAGYFQNLGLEGYLDGVHKLDSIIASVPMRCQVTVRGQGGYTQNMDIYWMFIGKRSKNQYEDSTVVPDIYDADRMYAVINGGKDTVIIQAHVFGKILRRGYEFYGEDEQEE